MNTDDKVTELLQDIKRLLILALTEQDVPGKRIAAALGVDAATISRIVSPKKSKRRQSYARRPSVSH